ncbi:AP-4 complex subunit sigma-1-like [Gigantopelta aegis]|uniref:AP-4 complex subunit sigma-1-like n=1 Tax=Gigantopelta aegis TaxID=1735272 RepID=UPI001B88B986|nr:AP-4 complex subunit sigma-1-like [Gigantopelta aegis]
MIRFLYIVNKQGQLRVCRYFEYVPDKKRSSLHTSVVRNCLNRNDKQCTFFEYEDFTVVYRKYVNLYFIAGITKEENELAVIELIHNFVETLNQYFGKVSELDIMYNQDRVYMLIDDMLLNGQAAETSRTRALVPLQLLDTAKK